MAKELSIGVTCKAYRPDILELAKDVYVYLQGKCKLCFKRELAKKIRAKVPFIETQSSLLDVIISIGGDGTVLLTVDQLKGAKTAVLGIKRGGKGFLSEIESGFEESLDRVLKGDYFVEERMKLDVEVNGKKIGEVLNDAVVCTDTPGKIQHLSLEVHGEEIEHLSADGIIFSTPTGSTAYSLSAGGPILEPTLDVYEITPICPFRLNPRSIVLPTKTHTEVRLLKERKGLVILDGSKNFKITNKDIVRIVKSSNKAYFVRFKKDNLNKVRRLLS